VLSGADLSSAVLADATFRGAVLTGIDVAELRLPAAALQGCVLDPTPQAWARRDAMLAALDEAEAWAASNGRRGQPANFDHMDLRVLGNALEKRTLPAFSARHAVAVGVSFAGSQLQGAAFLGADLRDAKFDGADLRGAAFRDTRMAFATFVGADVTPLQLSGSAVKPTDFQGAETTGVTLPL